MQESSSRSSHKTIFQPPAISPAKPVPPSGTSRPFPTPFSEDVKLEGTTWEEKSPLHKVQDGKINKRKNNMKRKSVSGGKDDFINAKLRRMIHPRAPVMILRELAHSMNVVETYRFLEPVEEVIDGQTLTLFPCEVEINGGTYSGSAPDQEISKNLAAESAIQAYTVHAVNGEAPNPETSDPIDNAPWAALASLGLFKLFNDWQSRGFALPLNNVPGQMGQQPSGKVEVVASPSQASFIPKPCKNIPVDLTGKHPVSLLNELYPGTPFSSSLHSAQSDMFQMSVSLEGQTFTGSGRSKKDAKKFCAMAALKELRNIDYSNPG